MTTDYHDFTWRDMPIERRKILNTGDIYVNAAICHICDYFIRSRNRHDFVTCKCGNVSVDGGSNYARRLFKQADSFTDVIEYFTNLEEDNE